jgi:uncharacterized protein
VRSILVAAIFLTAMAFACPRPETGPKQVSGVPRVSIITGSGQEAVVEVELARTAEQHRLGLMYRKEMAQDRGMLFIMPYAENQRFWMKNTFIPLDMIFIGNDLKVVGVVENAMPETTSTYEVGRPSRYVLEVNAGYCAKHQVREGQAVKFSGFEAD